MTEQTTERTAPRKRMLSGIKPSGDLTLGSYLGAIRNWRDRAEEFDCYYFMADLHAITVRQNPADLRRRTMEQLAQYIACGLDPEKNVLFIQSHVHQHAELGWVLNCYSMFGELSRMTQFKDKSAKNADNINGGLFTYPALMAADILLYQADLVPVGEDQKQHVELTRNIAKRFNGIYGDVFKLPEPYIPKVGARIMSLANPEAKMSKSENDDPGRVCLMDKPEDIMRLFKRAITDCESEVRYDPEHKKGVSNLMTIYSAATGQDVRRDRGGICRARLRRLQEDGRRGRRGAAAAHPRGEPDACWPTRPICRASARAARRRRPMLRKKRCARFIKRSASWRADRGAEHDYGSEFHCQGPAVAHCGGGAGLCGHAARQAAGAARRRDGCAEGRAPHAQDPHPAHGRPRHLLRVPAIDGAVLCRASTVQLQRHLARCDDHRRARHSGRYPDAQCPAEI